MLSRAESLELALSGAGETFRVLCQETRGLSTEDSLSDIAAPTGDLRWVRGGENGRHWTAYREIEIAV